MGASSMAREFISMPGTVTGFGCPDCGRADAKGHYKKFWTIKGWKRGPMGHSVLGVFVNDGGALEGLRLHCNSCEHTWTEEALNMEVH